MNHEIEIDSPHSHFILVESDTDGACICCLMPSTSTTTTSGSRPSCQHGMWTVDGSPTLLIARYSLSCATLFSNRRWFRALQVSLQELIAFRFVHRVTDSITTARATFPGARSMPSLYAPRPAVQQSRNTTHQGWPQEIAMPPPRGQASSSHLTKRLQFWHLRYNTCSPTALERLAFSVTRRPADSTSDGEGHRPIACPPGAWRLTYQTATAEPAEADRR